jgi:oligopeptide/dipeptide ABC transporter ATP-binding protein
MTTGSERPAGAPLLEVSGLRKTFSAKQLLGPSRRVEAARDVSFQVFAGEAVALVGESGSGKSTIARILLRLETPDAGAIRLAGDDVLAREPRRASLAYRRRVQMVFQDPFGSLNPMHRVRHHLERPLVRHAAGTPSDVNRRVLDLLRTVGLDPPEEFVDRYPHELSGGQRQRVAIARALAVSPLLLVADEPTSMLDVSVRMGVLNLLARLKHERRLAILLITHDLTSARYLADRILVLYRGRVVETGSCEDVLRAPAHPYTRALLAAIADAAPAAPPRPVPGAGREDLVAGGCPFAARCPERMAICDRSDPEAREFEGRRVRCHLYPVSSSAALVAGASS